MEEETKQTYPPQDFALPPRSPHLHYLFIFILVVFVLSALIALVMYVNVEKQRTIVHEEVKILTASEVQEHRNRLPTETVSYVLPDIVFDEDGQRQVTPVSPIYNFATQDSDRTDSPTTMTTPPPSANPSQGGGTSLQGISSIDTTPVPLPDSLKPKPVQPMQASTVTTSGGGSDETQVGEKKWYEIQGEAFIVSPEYGYLTLLDRTRNRELTILVHASTEVTILGGRATLSAIESGDTVYVKGEGYEDSGRIDATSITVTAREEFILIR